MDFFNLLLQADVITKCIVGFLGVTSIINGALIIYKMVILKREARSMKRLLSFIRSSKTREELLFIRKHSYSEITRSFFDAIMIQYDSCFSPLYASLSNEEKQEKIEIFEQYAYQSLVAFVMRLEQGMPVLSISAVVSPLIGLFGTVWGLIHSFMNISHEKSVDLLVIAPGVAEALITTLAGLIVAIPATIFFHYFSNEIRKLENITSVMIDSLILAVRTHGLKEQL